MRGPIETLEDRLRRQVLGLLHAGQLQTGDRLPSIRQIARETGEDHRAVAAAFRRLEADDLVEIRPGSGVYVRAERPAAGTDDSRVGWIADILMDGWSRSSHRKQVGELVRRVGTARVRCGLIESNDDHMAAFAEELKADFLAEVVEIRVAADSTGEDVDRAVLDRCDVICTSAFHQDLAAALAYDAGCALVVLTVNPAFAAELDRRLRERPLTAIAVDPGYGLRAAAHLAVTTHRGRGRFLLVDEMREAGVRPGDPDVILTLAARRRLGLEPYHLIPSPPALVSPESARALLTEISRCAMMTGDARAV